MNPDANIIGSGPNGLAAAIILAQAGRSVRVYEAQPTLGGGARSAELTLPGFVHDLGSAIHPMAAGSPFFRSLPLERHGLEWVQPEIALAHPFDDGSAAALYPSLEQTCAGLEVDGDAYGKLMSPFVKRWEALSGEFLQPLLHLPRHPFFLAGFGWSAVQPVTLLAKRLFRGEHARGLFAGLGGHSLLPLEAPASTSFALVLAAAGHAVGWPLPRGGAQKISDALAGFLRGLGGEIEVNRPVEDLDQLPPTRTTLLDLSVWRAGKVAASRLPASFRRRLERFPHGPGIFKVDYALDGPVPWKSDLCRRAGTVHLGGSLEEVAASEREVAAGRVPKRPFILAAQQSVCDPTRAPAGKHTLWAYCHAPLGCEVDLTPRIEAQIERFAPGFRDRVLSRYVSGPREVEASNASLVGGDISGGATNLWHLLARPRLSVSPYRLPGKGLYLCSSSTPPGGGVHGMCGYHAANTALSRELK